MTDINTHLEVSIQIEQTIHRIHVTTVAFFVWKFNAVGQMNLSAKNNSDSKQSLQFDKATTRILIWKKVMDEKQSKISAHNVKRQQVFLGGPSTQKVFYVQ